MMAGFHFASAAGCVAAGYLSEATLLQVKVYIVRCSSPRVGCSSRPVPQHVLAGEPGSPISIRALGQTLTSSLFSHHPLPFRPVRPSLHAAWLDSLHTPPSARKTGRRTGRVFSDASQIEGSDLFLTGRMVKRVRHQERNHQTN